MSETPPVPPDAARPAGRKRPSRGFWLAIGVITLLLAAIVSLSLLGVVEVRDGPRPDDGIRQMITALKIYASEHDGHLPPTLRVMIPDYLSEQNFDDFRYVAPKTKERLDWLYFPWENLDALPPDTIVLASPNMLRNTAGAQLRIATNAAGETDYIPEADFQRLIREQNPR